MKVFTTHPYTHSTIKYCIQLNNESHSLINNYSQSLITSRNNRKVRRLTERFTTQPSDSRLAA